MVAHFFVPTFCMGNRAFATSAGVVSRETIVKGPEMCNVDDGPSPTEEIQPQRSNAIDDNVERDIAAVDAVDYLSPPRHGIRHLLAWLTVSAVMLRFLVLPQSSFFSLDGPALQAQQHAMGIFRAAYFSAVLCAAVVLLRTKLRGTPGPFQPGHWICLAMAPCLATIAFVENGLSGYLASANHLLSGFGRAATGLVLWPVLIQVAVFVWCTIQRMYTSAWWWRLAFLVFSLASAYAFLMDLDWLWLLPGTPIVHHPEAHGACVAIVLAIVAAVSSDWVFCVRRDWLHWLGVGSMFVDCLVCLAL